MTSKTLIVSFAGHGLKYGGVPKIEFANFLKHHFPHIDAQFYIDMNCKSYHHGMQGISKNIEETVEYLKQKFENYDRVICLGASAGGYAAILFGSLLDVVSVIAFIPQTVLRSKDRDEKYRNIAPHINTTTKYHIYGDVSILDENNYHHISQCENISMFPNVALTKLHGVNLRNMKINGQLLHIMNTIINKDNQTNQSSCTTVTKDIGHIFNRFPGLQRFLPMI
jgi:1-aminocyclopropane-1-carboxylate deaminase/D-cysteine desulfhydrase-like pyridoxal-dependent ACC family enzyme